jgi:hypothetical protein
MKVCSRFSLVVYHRHSSTYLSLYERNPIGTAHIGSLLELLPADISEQHALDHSPWAALHTFATYVSLRPMAVVAIQESPSVSSPLILALLVRVRYDLLHSGG